MPRRCRHGVEEVGAGYLMVKLEGRFGDARSSENRRYNSNPVRVDGSW